MPLRLQVVIVAYTKRHSARRSVVLAETIWVLDAVHGRSTPQLAAAIEMMLNHEHRSIQDSDVVARALGQFRAQPKVGFSDCLVLEIARKAGHLPLEPLTGTCRGCRTRSASEDRTPESAQLAFA